MTAGAVTGYPSPRVAGATIKLHGVVPTTEAIDAALRRFFADRRAGADLIGPGFAAPVAALERYALRGGKRVRPTFAYPGWIGAGGDETGLAAGAVLCTCAAMELLHAATLIHDDVVDASETRRGFPAAHIAFAEQHRAHGWSGDPATFGQSAAILVGDVALAWADDMIRTAGLTADAHARVDPLWSLMRIEVLAGQLLDLTAEASGAEDADTALRIDRYKTASYTVEHPLLIGAALAGADADLIAAYRKFGAEIGLAYQLRDDMLGVFGDPVTTGKPSWDDLREGKRTVLLAAALAAADKRDPAAAAFLRARIGTDVTHEDVITIRAIVTELGAVDHVGRDIARRTERAVAALKTSNATRYAKNRLAAMAFRATQRSF